MGPIDKKSALGQAMAWTTLSADRNAPLVYAMVWVSKSAMPLV